MRLGRLFDEFDLNDEFYLFDELDLNVDKG